MTSRDPSSESAPARPSPEGPSPSVAFFRAKIKGRVQGVGFRMWTIDVAESLGVNGWVRNCWDGAVEVEAEGPRDVLEAFARRLQEGPTLARVRDVEIEWGQRPGRYRQFTVGY